jgi:hypothetical protein
MNIKRQFSDDGSPLLFFCRWFAVVRRTATGAPALTLCSRRTKPGVAAPAFRSDVLVWDGTAVRPFST